MNHELEVTVGYEVLVMVFFFSVKCDSMYQ